MPQLALQSWPEVEAYLERSKLVLIPIGSTEQHGPNGLIGTDFICAQAVAETAADEIGALVAPPICVGMALHHMAFPGTISLQPSTLMAVIGDVLRSLHAHGFRVFAFVNGHGGNISTGNAAMSAAREELPDADLRWFNWYQAPSVRKRCAELYGDREGGHATPSEIALTMAVHPGAVKPIAGPMELESCRPRGIPSSARFRECYPDGRIGSDPSMARPDDGAELLRLSASDLAAELRDLM